LYEPHYVTKEEEQATQVMCTVPFCVRVSTSWSVACYGGRVI